MPHNENLSHEYYYNKFKQIFSEKKDYISYYGKEVNIWGEFYDNRTDKAVSGLSDVNNIKFVDRWIDSKRMDEQSWYIKYYEKFYKLKYLVFLQRIKNYKLNRGYSEVKPFYEWFLNEYLKKERFP